MQPPIAYLEESGVTLTYQSNTSLGSSNYSRRYLPMQNEMDDLDLLNGNLRGKLLDLAKSSASEEKFIEYISSKLRISSNLDVKALEIVLDLTLAVVDQYGYVNFNHFEARNNSVIKNEEITAEEDKRVPELSSYDGDDEDLDDTFIFPCHIMYDDCHPELLSDYHREHLKPSRESAHIIKLPKLCEFVIEFMLDSFRDYISNRRDLSRSSSNQSIDDQANQSELSDGEDAPHIKVASDGKSLSAPNYLRFIVKLIKKVNKVCLNERRNCRILSKTGILSLLLQNIDFLLQTVPEEQHIYLEPLLKFAFTLADYRISGANLRQLFGVLKNEETDLKVVLKNLERLLSHHYRILRNIQPSKSMNFPVASKTPEEIEYDFYVANSWHWRLRSKVIESKRKRSRTDSQSQDLKLQANQDQSNTSSSNSKLKQLSEDVEGKQSPPPSSGRITPSWLECSLITPLSNISPLMHNGEVKFCCSMWMSVCGDLLVIEGSKAAQRKRAREDNGDNFDIDWNTLEGHWLRLTSRRRLVRRYKNKKVLNMKPRKRRLSAKIRRRQAYDKEDEELEEIEEKVRKSDAEMSQGHSRNGRRFKLFHSSLSRQPKTSPINKQRDNLLKKARILDPKHNKADDQGPPREYLGRRARDNAQELLIHLVSFAMDSLTIEIWLNVKCMTFCARACRVTREGQTNLLDQVTFSSHLEANGSWSNLIFCFEEQHTSADEKVMNFKVIVNGIHKEKEKLVYSAPKSPVTNFALLIGCERSTFGYVWKLSQINIYKNIPDKSLPIYLLGKGPDFWSFTNFRQQSLLPLPDITQRHMRNVLQPKVLLRYSTIDEDQALNWLTQNIVISYVAHQPEHFLDYSLSVTPASIINPLPADYEFSNSAERFIQAKTLDFSRSLKFNQNNGFGSALVEAGGIESVLMSFAEVVRRSPDDPQAHALAFSVLLKMSQTNLYHLNKFLDELNGLKLAEYILAHPRCKVSRPMLNSYLEFCLMWHSKSTRCLIKSPKLIYHLMTAWRAWHKDARVARQLYRRLIKLLQPIEVSRRTVTAEHKLDCYYISHNFSVMTQAGGIDILMDILRECLVSAAESPPFINHDLIELIINLISLLIKHPPRLDVMLDIMEFLLFLHPDPKAYVEVTHDRLYYLHPIHGSERERVMFDEMHASGARTPYSESESDSEVSSSYDDVRRPPRPANGAQELPSESSGSGARPEPQRHDYFTEEDEEVEEDEEDSGSYVERISNQCSRDLTEFIEKCNAQNARDKDVKMSWIYGELNDKYEMLHKLGEVDPSRCSNRNFAIANIADMLASMVKLTSSDPMKILTEALQKHIIDPRKLIILANNDSPLVREKVLRLFLYCIRACYSLGLKSILSEYEQKSKSENYNICVPLHLMARQLLKYSTTIRMVQLCYGIIVGVDDFETVDSVCLIFDIEVLNNHLQLNTLVLLMQLITQLRQPKDIVSGLQFVHAYIKQLLQLGEETTVSIMIKNNLVDCIMSLYFSYVETTIVSAHHRLGNNNFAYGDQHEPTELGHKKSEATSGDVVQELDRLLLLIVRFFIQNQSTDEMIKSTEELLSHFDLLNTKVPIEYRHILRDRSIKILLTSLRYCRYYVDCAKRKKYGGRFFDLIKKSERFSNVLPESELCQLINIDREQSDHLMSSIIVNFIGGDHCNDEGTMDTRGNWDDEDVDSDLPDVGDSKSISEMDVLKRFRATCALVEMFVVTREPTSTIKDFERNFILSCLKLLAHNLTEFNQSKSLGRNMQSTFWHRMLSKLEEEKLEKSTFRRCFSELILYLLSPIMSVDARKLFAQQILNNFTVYNLLHMLEENSSDRWNHRVLLVFIKDLIERGSPRDGGPLNGDEIASDMDEDVELNDTAVELRQLIRGLESEVDACDIKRSSSKKSPTVQDSRLDQQHRAIWLANSAQGRENHRDRLVSLEIEFRHTSKLQGMAAASSLDNLTSLTEDTDKFMDHATSITKDVVNDKHEQRKAYLEDVKQSKIYNYHIRQQWLSIIIGHSHERAIWYMEDFYPKSWELNPVEGPSRTRRRLRPCKLKLESRFLRHPTRSTSAIGEARSPLSGKDTPNSQMNDLVVDDWYSHYSPHPLCSLIINNEQSMDSNELRIRMFTTDKIHFNCDCSIIRPNEVCDGEVSIASWCIHFIGERSDDCDNSISNNNNNNNNGMTKHLRSRHSFVKHPPATPTSNRDAISYGGRSTFDGTKSTISMQSFATTIVEDLWFDEIVEIWDRRYQLQDVGLEIFLTNNMTYLLSFRNNRDREDFKQHLMREQHKMINLQRFNLTTSLNRLTQMWRDGKLTNFDYLTCLNKLAGRSFNDLMQYPIFPFILSNYHSEHLDLNDPGNFRNLKRPMAIQNEAREANFKNNYQMSQSSSLNIGALGLTKPYHYGNHYSNSATVLHFLVRLPPFTQMLIQYQDNNFDQPDRTFHAIANTWQLITRDSNTDFKELIPEFFFLPEMFLNIGELDLGRKQNNELVNDVRLPPWCSDSDARLFTLIHRQALESPHVSENLHHWVDLIFGFKQTGKAAIDAINVFHPATYYGGIDLSGQQKSPSSTATDSMSIINLAIATRSARSSNPGSDYTSNVDLPAYQTPAATNSGTDTITPVSASENSPRRVVLTRYHQADIERSALETMIKTYGQMPRQLFSTPMKQRSPVTFAQQIIESQQEKQHLEEAGDGAPKSLLLSKKIEPMRQVRGLKWGNYVGSPSDNDIIAVKHKRIILEQVRDYRSKSKKSKNKSDGNARSVQTNGESGAQQLSKQSDKFHFCLLANGDVAILRNNTSLMLDYRADRKSSGIHQLSVPSARYSRRAGLSRVSRMNLFSNMIISRQQFSFLEPIHSPSYQSPESPTASVSSSSLVATLTGSRVKFSLDSLNLVSWLYLDGTIRVKHPAISSQKPSIPLVQANTIVDTMSTCASVPELNLLLVGYNSGSICAHIVSTTYETSPLPRYIPTISTGATSSSPSAAAAAALSSSSAAPSAVHFLHTTTSSSQDGSLLGPGRVTEKTLTGEPYTAVSLAGKTLQSVRSMNRTTRWLYCHSKRVNCIKINVSFGIVVTSSEDGTGVIWDLNSLTFVRTIDYKLESLRTREEEHRTRLDEDSFSWAYGRAKRHKVDIYLCHCQTGDASGDRHGASKEANLDSQQSVDQPRTHQAQKCYICASGVDLIAISDTLGDIVTVKHLRNREAAASNEFEQADDDVDQLSSTHSKSVSAISEDASSTISSASSASESTLTSVLYVHTINGSLVNFVDCHNQVTAVSYSNAPEGISINVIVVGMVDGLIRLYSSWDLSRVKEFRVSGLCSPINDVMYTRDSQLMYIAYEDGQMVVLRNKRKGSISMPKEWIL